MNPDAVPLLDDAALLALSQTGDIPTRWRMPLLSDALRPTARRGDVLTLERRPPRPGSIVCIETAGRIAWRRVLAVVGDRAVVRCEIAPFADRWQGAVLGVAVVPGWKAAVGARLPALWTSAGWYAALAHSHARLLPGRLRAALAPAMRLHARPLGRDDDRPYRERLARLYGSHPTPIPLSAERAFIGLFADDSALVGMTILVCHGGEGHSVSTAVDQAYRGRGGATLLLREAIREAARRGLRRVYGSVAARNLPSLAACRQAGLVPTGRWWSDPHDPLLSAERQWLEVAIDLA